MDRFAGFMGLALVVLVVAGAPDVAVADAPACAEPDGCSRAYGDRGNQRKHILCREAWNLYDACRDRVSSFSTPVSTRGFSRPLVEMTSPPRPGQFVRFDEVSNEFEVVSSPCNIEFETDETSRTALYTGWREDIRRLASQAISREGVEGPSEEWSNVLWTSTGIATRTIEAGLDVNVPAVRVGADFGSDGVSFQAWRESGATQRLADPRSVEVRSCCANTDCGDYLVTDTRELERYEWVYSATDVSVQASTAVWNASANTAIANGNETFSRFTELELVAVGSPNEPVHELCNVRPLWSLTRNREVELTIACDAQGVAFSGQNVEVLDQSVEPSAVGMSWLYRVRVQSDVAPGTIGSLVYSMSNDRTAQSAIVVSSHGDMLPTIEFIDDELVGWMVRVTIPSTDRVIEAPLPHRAVAPARERNDEGPALELDSDQNLQLISLGD